MSIPLASTTISVLRSSQTAQYVEPYGGDVSRGWKITAKGVRAVIGAPGGSEIVRGGEQEVVMYSLHCDPVNIDHTSRVLDEKTGEQFEVVWIKKRTGLGMSYMTGQLRQVEGLV